MCFGAFNGAVGGSIVKIPFCMCHGGSGRWNAHVVKMLGVVVWCFELYY